MFRRLFRNQSQSNQRVALGREFSVGDVLEQRFEIEQVRRGYMGIVYIAYDRQRRGRVVLKTFQNKFLWDEMAITRFSAEAELWMRLGSHPNIVRAFDTRTFLGKPHVLAEYVHGGPLRALIGHLELKEALDYAIQICWGMDYAADQAAIIHCDLKPDNIMVTLDGQAKVTDFGLARVMPHWQWSERARARPNTRMRAEISDAPGGTLPYMAPELFELTPYPGIWSDIYAYGVMLFEFFTGKLPFDSPRDDALIRMHQTQPAPDPREYKPHLAREAAQIVLRCLAKRPSERYPGFQAIERDLQALRELLFEERYQVVWPTGASVERDRLIERGMLHMDVSEYSEALSCFRRAVSLDPNQPSGWACVARARLKLWQYNEALMAIEEGLKRAGSRNEFVDLYQVRGETYAAMMRPNDAAVAYDQGLSYRPNAPSLWREKGALFLRMSMPREAREALLQALKYDQLDSEAWRLHGDVYLAQEKYRQAHQAYAETLKLNPRAASAWARYGICQHRLGRPQDALRSFEAALKLDENLQEALDGARQAAQELKRSKSS